MECCGHLHLSLTRRLWVSSTSSQWIHKAYYHIGRILSRLSKDQDTLDTQLAQTLYTVSLFPLTSTSLFIYASRQLLSIFSNVLGTVALVFYTFPYLGIIFAPLSVLYYLVSAYYRRSSVETKRLDSLLRSALYASYQGNRLRFFSKYVVTHSCAETLTGLSTVRAYRRQVIIIIQYFEPWNLLHPYRKRLSELRNMA